MVVIAHRGCQAWRDIRAVGAAMGWSERISPRDSESQKSEKSVPAPKMMTIR